MRKHALKRLIQLVLALLVFAPPLSEAIPIKAATLSPYVVTDIGTFGGPVSIPMDLNATGQVVGTAQTALPDLNYPNDPDLRLTKVFLYTSGTLTDPRLNLCRAVGDNILALTDSSAIFYVAPGTSGCDTPRLARYEGGRITFVDIDGTFLSIQDSNSRQQVLIAYSARSAQQGYGSYLYEGGALHRLPDPFGYGGRWFSINEEGVIAGEIRVGPIVRHAAVLDQNGYRDIHPFSVDGYSTASCINNTGLVVGTYFGNDQDPSRAFSYDTRTGTTIDLGPGSAIAINDRGQILGRSHDPAGGLPALYDGQQFRILQGLVPADTSWVISEATHINNAGQIIATGYLPNSRERHALLLSPRLYDVPADSPYRAAIVALTERGIIQGYADGRFGPADLVLRAQSAALIARAAGWDAEDWPDATFPDRGPIDDDLWRNVRTLAHYGVAQGYADGTYDPTGPVLHQQAILFITRALIEKGFWTLADDTAPYPNLPNGTARARADRRAIATYVREAGAIPDRPVGQPWADWNTPASRGWYAQVLYQALATLPSTQPIP